MAAPIGGLKYWEVEFDKDGRLVGDGNLQTELATSGVQDLFVFSHGWNSTEAGARSLYTDIFRLLAGMLPGRQQTAGLVGVFWPSLLFPEDGPAADGSPAPMAVLPDGARVAVQSSGAELAAALRDKFPGQEQEVETLGTMLDTREQDGAALSTFHQLATGLVTTPETGGPEDNGEAAAISASPRETLEELAAAPGEARADTQGMFNPFDLAWRGARELLRGMSYYEMKNRAGVVGSRGLGPLLSRLRTAGGQPRVHLMGHSFGARLVSYGLTGLPAHMTGAASPVKSLLLVQGAFSHFTFSPQKPGALQAMANRVDGPMLATHSMHDRAVGLWYPNASRLARQSNQDIEDFNFEWGAMGHDGYQQNGAIDLSLLRQGTRYQLRKGSFYRLNANNVIKQNQSVFAQAHSDIRHPEIAWAAASAAGLA